jgi:hypothetical protein
MRGFMLRIGGRWGRRCERRVRADGGERVLFYGDRYLGEGVYGVVYWSGLAIGVFYIGVYVG